MVAIEPAVSEEELPPAPEKPAASEARQIYVRRNVELARYGRAERCPGRDAVRGGRAPRAHSGACRARIEAAILADNGKRADFLKEVKKFRGEKIDVERQEAAASPPAGGAAGAAAGSAEAPCEASTAAEAPPPRPVEAAKRAAEDSEQVAQAMENADLFMDSRDGRESQNVAEDASRNILDSRPPKRMRTIMGIVKHEVQSLGGRFSDVKFDPGDVSEEQLTDGLGVIHEYPHSASSGKDPRVQARFARPDARWVRNDQCAAGQTTTDDRGGAVPARKTAGWITSMREVAEEVGRCQWWADVNKGDSERMETRPRLVAKEFEWRDPLMEGIFAAMPPLEAPRYEACSIVDDHHQKERMLEGAKEGFVGPLKRAMHGARDAAHQCDKFSSGCIQTAGYRTGKSCPRIYIHSSEESVGWRHGDEMVMVFGGEGEVVDRAFKVLRIPMILKLRARLGFDSGDAKHISILSRLLTFEVCDGKHVIRYEPDPRHAEILVLTFGLNRPSAKRVSTPGEKSGDYDDDRELDSGFATTYRSGTMRLRYLDQDLPHLQFVANRVARHMANPVVGGFNRMKRVARILKARPRWVVSFWEQEASTKIPVRSDSDWAGDVSTRKSVSSVRVVFGSHLIRAVTSAQ
ncbi:unnamed protein product, partial [Prorocentrum cordatum]